MMDNHVSKKNDVVYSGISKLYRMRFVVSFFLFSFLWMGSLAIIASVLLPQHLKNLVGATS